MAKNTLDIDRKTAGRLLGVSVRTIDRHIRAGKLMAREENGRIWLNKREILTYKDDSGFMWSPVKHKPIGTTARPHISPAIRGSDDAQFYRDLYEEAKKMAAEYQQKLEQSNYRIGQLESQLMHPHNHAPVMTKNTEWRERESAAAEMIRKELMDKEKETLLLKELVQKEKSSRIVFAILTYILLGLLPVIWYLLR